MLFEYVIMTNHIHLIACAKEGHKLSQIISDFKKHTTRAIFRSINPTSTDFSDIWLHNRASSFLNYFLGTTFGG